MKVKTLFPMKLCVSMLLAFFIGQWRIQADTLNSSGTVPVQQAELVRVSGIVLDDSGLPLPGASVLEHGTQNMSVTDKDGRFTINVTTNSKLEIIYMGFMTKLVDVNPDKVMRIVLKPDVAMLEETVVIGYGVQKKETSVGSVASVKSEELLKSGGVTNVGQAIQGKIPGVVTLFTNGEPGADNMQIYIRGQSSWNNAGSPLVLVDGIERSMNDVNMEDIESISVLKDASATAVYGVKGANGVILLTSKRGQEGKAEFSISANAVMKTISKVPEKCDAYDAMMVMNEAVMNEIAYNQPAWDLVTPEKVASLYRNQTTQDEMEMYPNVDWKNYMYRKVTPDYQVNANVRGGNKFAKYFCSVGYLRENDIIKPFDNGKGYKSGFNYNRLNYRANIDLDITKTTKLSVNVSGVYGVKHEPHTIDGTDKLRLYLSLYNLAPDIYYPMYSDGAYGFPDSPDFGLANTLMHHISMGTDKTHNFKVNADIKLLQNLDFITKGLSAHVRFTMDNSMAGRQSITDRTQNGLNGVMKRYDPKLEKWVYQHALQGSDYDYSPAPWTLSNFTVGSAKRRLIDYEAAINYNRTFKKHTVGALALFKRQEYASGNMFRSYNEDWVFRLTYDFDKRYLLEANGAYNGSEQFGPGYRFDFFPSVGLGWVLSNEKFMQNVKWIDRIKFRASVGLVGDDNFTDKRWLYMSQWAPMNKVVAMNCPGYFWDLTVPGTHSPYMNYKEVLMGNKDIHWESSLKQDYGVEFSFLNGSVSGEFDYFLENRRDIYIPGEERSINDLIGITPPGANIGKVNVRGFEAILKLYHSFNSHSSIFGDFSFTHAVDKIIFRDDPKYKPAYQKREGHSIGQHMVAIPGDIMQNWDDVYMSTPLSNGDLNKRVGYYDVVDFNGDGYFDGKYDNAPYGYPTRPQDTWTASIGGEWKGISLQVQFFGQFNTTRNYVLNSFSQNTHLFFKDNLDYWSKENPDGVKTLPALNVPLASNDPIRNFVDASMVRLKMVELAYRLPAKACKSIGIKGLRIFFNGNNLALWTKMADDRDFGTGNRGAYPTMRRFNIGLNFNL